MGDGKWLATVHTTGPWDAAAQHGGPPSALLGRAMQRCATRDDMIIARFTCEILRPIPVGEIRVQARLARPERGAAGGGRQRRRPRGGARHRLAGAAHRQPAGPAPPRAAAPPAHRDAAPAVQGRLGGRVPVGHRMAAGARPLHRARARDPLLPDEETGPLERVLAIADSGNGVASALDIRRWQFINPELTVHLQREAAGEWICLDARTAISTGGAGLATSVISDLDGQVGVGAQSLLVSPRPG